MVKITIEYSGNFSYDRKPQEVHRILTRRGFKPASLFLRHNVDRETGECMYIFNKETKLPTQRELERMLASVGLIGIVIEDNS